MYPYRWRLHSNIAWPLFDNGKELQRKRDAEEQELKAMQKKKAITQDMQRNLAEEWGVPWPKPITKDLRKGGPIPRSQKWHDGMYEWIHKVSTGELAKPAQTPPKVVPADWNPKFCSVWQYEQQVPDSEHAGPELQKSEHPKPQEQDTQPKAAASTEPDAPSPEQPEGGNNCKRAPHHAYPNEVIEFYFKFEQEMGGPRSGPTGVVAFVKAHYPSLFPASFNESRPRSWEPGLDHSSSHSSSPVLLAN